jgi:hypothetical protein
MAAVLQLQAPSRRTARRRRLISAALAGSLLLGVLAAVLLMHERRAPEVGPPDRPPDLADLWSGRASPVLARKWTSTGLGEPRGGAYAGAHIEVVGDTWYLFNRSWLTEQCPGRDGQQLGTQVRASSDQGATWSKPVQILSPTPGTPWSCAATDGDAVYDAAAGTWRYLFQCLAEQGGWNGCYAERHAPSPLGRFTPPSADMNPVIAPGSLWGQICDPGDRCAQPPGSPPFVDEGTFNLLSAPDGSWWVGFHGSDGTHGVRGVARTTTFRAGDWAVDGAAGTPTDAILSAADATGWRENWRAGGPVGAGAATILLEDGWYYQVAEFPDVSLACTRNQTWDFGLFRARQLSSTTWEQYPGGNALVYSSRAPGADGQSEPCNIQYPGLFRDPSTGVSYLMHGRVSGDPAYDAIYLYRLEWDRNLVRNGDFWRADVNGWARTPGATLELAAERAPDTSPDGTPDLAFSCGVSCNGGIYQDVQAPTGAAGETLAFGGTFKGANGTSALELSVEQFDAAGAPIATQTLPVSAGATYANARGTVELDSRTAHLRFMITPRAPGLLRADNLYLIPQSGCDAPRYPAC